MDLNESLISPGVLALVTTVLSAMGDLFAKCSLMNGTRVCNMHVENS